MAIHQIETRTNNEIDRLERSLRNIQGCVDKLTAKINEMVVPQLNSYQSNVNVNANGNNYRGNRQGNSYDEADQNRPNRYNPRMFNKDDRRQAKIDRTPDGKLICIDMHHLVLQQGRPY